MNYKHGKTVLANRHNRDAGWRTHGVWVKMRARCEDQAGKSYPDYGGRGIKVCDRWQTFENFLADMGPAPEGMSIDRVDNDGDYEPSNCRWADRKTQNSNRRSIRWLEHDGKRMSVSDWARHLGVPIQRIKNRVHRGWPLERILSPEDLGEYGRFGPHKIRGVDF